VCSQTGSRRHLRSLINKWYLYGLVFIMDGFGSDTHGYNFEYHYLPHFVPSSDTNTNIIKYEYKTDILNSDSHSNTYSIYSIES
jgi:hypothetical protein